jgi:hypothetical protein
MAKKVPKKKGRGGARRGAGRPKKRHLEDYAQIGPPPADPLRATEWGMQLLTVMLEKVKSDPDIDERTRRAEMKALLRNMKDLVPPARISAAERVILEAERKRTAPAGPVQGTEELSDASPLDPPPLAASPGAVLR